MADLGFFSPTKIVKKKKVNERKIVACESCGAYKNCSSPKLGLSGNGDKGILIIGNPVTRREDITGKVFSDMSSAYLREELSNIGVSLERDCWSMNSVQCMTEKTTPAMLEGCRRRLDKTIRELKPKKILLLGETATDMFLHNRIQKSRVGSGNMERWLHDELIPDQEYGCFVSVCYHPSFVVSALTERKKLMKKWGSYREKEGQQLWHNKKLLDDDNFRIRSLYFKKHLKVILQNKQFFKEDYEKYCSFIPTVEEAISLMRAMKKSKYLGWDLETTSLQPYGDDSEILCVSMSDGTTSYSFPFFVDDKRFMRVFKNVLTNSEAKTIIANAQFEENYTRAKTGISTIEHCCHDTVLAAHIISPTISGNTGLKVNAYKVCGVIGFDAEVEPFIKGRVEKDPYSLNRLKELPIKTVGIYNAMDSLLTAKVAFYQMNIINNNPKLNSVFDLYMRGQVAFADMSFQGFVVDETQLIKNEMELEQKLTVIEYDLKNTNEVGRWYKEHPNTEFNFKSNKHLSELFFDLLDYSTGKVTASGGASIDKDVLEEFSKTSELARLLCEYKKIFKLKNTDLKGLRFNTHNGKIHPFFGLSQASTGRSNSSKMNFQNLNNSDPYAVKMVRSCLKGHEGHEILMMDYHALEIFGGLSHHGDPNMEAELLDSDSVDAHTLMAQKVFGDNLEEVAMFCLKEKDGNSDPSKDDVKHFIKDELRKPCKNISFACAYGGSANRIFQTLWNENLRPYHKAWFKTLGMGTEDKFREHCKSIFEYYWERYKVFGEWRDEVWEQYLSKGYIYNKFGFRLSGICSKTFITNAPIQGSSYAVCLLAHIKLWEVMKEKGYKSKIIAAIHDSVEVSYDPTELFEGGLWEDIKTSMEDYVNRRVRWLKLPLSVAGEWFLGDWATEVEEEEVREKYNY